MLLAAAAANADAAIASVNKPLTLTSAELAKPLFIFSR